LFKAQAQKKIKNKKPFQTFLSRLKNSGNSVHSDLNPPIQTKYETKPEEEKVDSEKYHVTAAGRKFLIEQGMLFVRHTLPAYFTH
jgi:hypothetical protein